MKKQRLLGLGVAAMLICSASVAAAAAETAADARQLIEEMESEAETAVQSQSGIIAQSEAVPDAESEAQSEAAPAAESETASAPESEAQSEEIQAAESETEAAPSLTMDKESVHKIMIALGDKSLRTTRRFLLKDGVIEEGYKGDAGAGLQQMLTEFGCDLTVDGAVGGQTIEALHQVQDRFGLDRADRVDLAVYDTLVPLLLMTRGAQCPDVDLEGFYDAARGEGYYQYLMGCAMAGIGKYYSAREAFTASVWQDSRQRAEDCVQELPGSGLLWRSPDLTEAEAGLTFTVKGADDSDGKCFEVYNSEDQPVAAVFVRGSGSAKTDLPAGTYHIKEASGREWYGLAESFGPDGEYEYLTFSEDENVKYDAVLESGQYELAVNVSEIEEDATSVGSAKAGWEDFFQTE